MTFPGDGARAFRPVRKESLQTRRHQRSPFRASTFSALIIAARRTFYQLQPACHLAVAVINVQFSAGAGVTCPNIIEILSSV